MIATWKQHEGQAVDGIALLRLLGGGESSAVYLAERAGERCAIKFVPTEDVVAQLLLSRWEQASKLSHPHLCRILQWGRGHLDGVPLVYVALEYAEEELASVDRPLTPKEAREMLTPAAEALAYLHGKGFAHGRIKPSNILSVEDKLKISGDAPLRRGERQASTRGRQPYDAPELGASGVTPAGDVWSLGVCLVEAMTKDLPRFEAGVLRLPDTLRPDSFRHVAAGCLESDPARRWTVADITLWLDRGIVPAPKRPRPRYLVPIAAAIGVVALGAAAWEYAVPYFIASQSSAPAPAANVAPAPLPVNPPAAVPTPAPTVAPRESKATKEAKQEAKTENKAAAEPKPAAAVDAPSSAPAASFAAASGVTSPDVTQSFVPEVLAKARATIHGKVPIVVRVQADDGGAVTSAKIESGGSSRYFADLALKAARQWKFVPGANAREWLLRFEFTHVAQHPVSAQVILGP